MEVLFMLDITYIVEKNCFLNQIKDNHMSLEELRFLCIYLSRINARDVSTRCIRFTLSDFQKIMNIGRMNINFYKAVVNDLLGHVVHMPNDNGGLDSFQLFKKAKLFIDDNHECCVEIDVHDEALPLFFNLKGNYVTYELWNALRLKSANQLLMYELLKQYEKLGKIEIKVSELREYLSFLPGQYPQLERFKKYVLDSCQKALAENTDIRFTYEHGKRGLRGKWLTIIFHIYKNTDYKAPLELRDFIDKQSASQSDCTSDEQLQSSEQYQLDSSSSFSSSSKRQPYLSGEFDKDLAPADIKVLCDMLACKVPVASERTSELLEKRLKLLYGHMLVSSKEPIKNACAYLKGVIINLDPNKLPPIPTDDFDVDKYNCFINDFDSIKKEIKGDDFDVDYNLFINNYEVI